MRFLVGTRDGYSHLPEYQLGLIHLKEATMFLNVMARVAAREGLSIKQLLERKSREAEKLPPRKLGKPEAKRRDPFKGLSTRELYMRRPMD